MGHAEGNDPQLHERVQDDVRTLVVNRGDELIAGGLVNGVEEHLVVAPEISQVEQIDAHQVTEVAPPVIKTCRIDWPGFSKPGTRGALVRESGGDCLVRAAAEPNCPSKGPRSWMAEVRMRDFDRKQELMA